MARISELHYSNAYAEASGVNEFVEVALARGEDPAEFAIGLYDADGTQGMAIRLDNPGVQASYDSDTGEFVYVISADTFPFQLTDPDGIGSNYSAIALADTSDGGGVAHFYDIGGGTTGIEAQDGVAAGATSTNVPTPTNAGKADYTLQFNADNPDEVTYASLDPGSTGTICFCPGAQILTPSSWRPVEELGIGDVVLTRDSGAKPIAWIGHSRVSGLGKLAPVELRRGVLGATTALRVSPQHRILLAGPHVNLFTGDSEAFCAAMHLVDASGIRRLRTRYVSYIHLMFDRHEVIWANGVATESFYLGPGSIAAMSPNMRAEIDAIFPGLIEARDGSFGPLARPGLHPSEATLLRPHLTTDSARPG